MARFFSNAKLLSTVLADGVSINSRSFATGAPQGVATGVVRGGTRSGISKQGGEMKEGPKNSPWVPDPVTGYYRPENCADEIDVAELREALLNHKIRQH